MPTPVAAITPPRWVPYGISIICPDKKEENKLEDTIEKMTICTLTDDFFFM